MEVKKNWIKVKNTFTGRFVFLNMNLIQDFDPVFVPNDIERSYIKITMMSGDFFNIPYNPGILYQVLGFPKDETITLNIHDDAV